MAKTLLQLMASPKTVSRETLLYHISLSARALKFLLLTVSIGSGFMMFGLLDYGSSKSHAVNNCVVIGKASAAYTIWVEVDHEIAQLNVEPNLYHNITAGSEVKVLYRSGLLTNKKYDLRIKKQN